MLAYRFVKVPTDSVRSLTVGLESFGCLLHRQLGTIHHQAIIDPFRSFCP